MDTWEVDFSMPTVRNVVTVGSHAAPAVAGPDITPVTWTHSQATNPIPRATLIQLFCKPPGTITSDSATDSLAHFTLHFIFVWLDQNLVTRSSQPILTPK